MPTGSSAKIQKYPDAAAAAAFVFSAYRLSFSVKEFAFPSVTLERMELELCQSHPP